MLKDIVIFGAGGFGQEVLWTIEDINKEKNEWNVIGFLDDNEALWGKDFKGYPVIDPQQFLENHKGCFYMSNGIGTCAVKYKIRNRFNFSNIKFATLIHPSVIFGKGASLSGEGIIIQAGTILAPYCVIKNYVTINLDATIGHDAIVEDYATIAPGVHLSGFSKIGRGSNVGTGCAVIEGCVRW